MHLEFFFASNKDLGTWWQVRFWRKKEFPRSVFSRTASSFCWHMLCKWTCSILFSFGINSIVFMKFEISTIVLSNPAIRWSEQKYLEVLVWQLHWQAVLVYDGCYLAMLINLFDCLRAMTASCARFHLAVPLWVFGSFSIFWNKIARPK